VLDPYSHLPLYVQLRNALKRRIEVGEWKVGSQVPTESELMTAYRVGRATVRQALQELVNQGLLYRKQGKGTYVSRPRQEDDIESLISFTAEMTARGVTPSARVLGAWVIIPPAEVREQLGLKDNEKALRLERLRFGDGVPLALEMAHLNHVMVEGLEKEDLTGSLYHRLVHGHKLRITRVQQTIQPALASAREAELLGIRRGSPVLIIDRISYAGDGKPIEAMHFVYRGDLYQVKSELTRR
jgi:GntR family transcriptional regulator